MLESVVQKYNGDEDDHENGDDGRDDDGSVSGAVRCIRGRKKERLLEGKEKEKRKENVDCCCLFNRVEKVGVGNKFHEIIITPPT